MDNDYYDFLDHSIDYKPKKRGQRALTDQEIILRERMKLVKNRESAKNSRKRKKMYVDILENKVAGLNQQLEQYKQLQESSQEVLRSTQIQLLFGKPQSSQNQLNHYFNEIIEQAIPKIALHLKSNKSNPGLELCFQNFYNCFNDLNIIKEEMIQELKQTEETMKTVKEIPEFQKFIEHVNQLDYKVQLDNIEEELGTIIKSNDLMLSVREIYELYNQSIQFAKKPKLN
ncbi:unnamed protein product (macronuclear) [Paramecium tetraurelia]|uniref:BZIP domain-containing protein n=1 Tax=Paramecium tetraurelia TaxID=5888 RepID=A0BDL7_PARTE|nr:uncharacterized protein GSPATT00027663001 [Paramecium tetraurelia]CAK56634.1 unnamed protein product [Paramecium tetraurelia]|eukprot:XP_001424032.1 hypothetical protein (macronuclear) [Paramecium tetraurelia strain d4-2]